MNFLDPVFAFKMKNGVQQTAQNSFTAWLVEYPLKSEIIKYRIGFSQFTPDLKIRSMANPAAKSASTGKSNENRKREKFFLAS